MAESPQVRFLEKYVFITKWIGIPISRFAIETGTYRGEGTKVLAGIFSTVHTIELSDEWYEFSSRKLAAFKHITCHHGDSGEVLARIVPQITGPATFFLDAHYAGGTTARGTDEVPLLRELEVISQRPYTDFIIIDDLRLVGQKVESGSAGSPIYPLTTFDWRDITIDRIASVINRENRTHWIYENDRIVIFTRLSMIQAFCLKAMVPACNLGIGFLRFLRKIGRIALR